ncbi:hypothetical protein C1645_813784 [Glomus cerebriforme]|uniref:FAR1 domain-containing protein n=1 Tax=Glomus cerebriforme TaxID=658196 RepID=A0A397THK1_9GLOM|nr:hypothetical protein C1645_813784 [Glomus cerebriforme]
MNISELNTQESVITFMMTSYEGCIESENISKQVQQDDTNKDSTTSLCIDHTFRLWEDIDSMIEVYDKKHEFAIIKKRLDCHKDRSIKHRSFGCEFGGNYQLKKHIDVNNHRDHRLKCHEMQILISLKISKLPLLF